MNALATTIFAQKFDTQLKIMSKAFLHIKNYVFAKMIYPHSQAFQHLRLSLAVLMLAVPWNDANHDPFLELVLWHSSLLTALYISGIYIFLVEVFTK